MEGNVFVGRSVPENQEGIQAGVAGLHDRMGKKRTIDMEKEYFTREDFYNIPDDEKEGCKTFLLHYQVPITPDTLAAFNMGYHAGYNYHKYETEEGSDR